MALPLLLADMKGKADMNEDRPQAMEKGSEEIRSDHGSRRRRESMRRAVQRGSDCHLIDFVVAGRTYRGGQPT